MSQRRLKLLVVLMAGVLTSSLSAQASLTAYPILSVGLGARAVGMGESFTAVSDDISAIHYNSAGLAQIHQAELILMHNSYVADGFFETLGALYPCGDTGTLALGVNYLNYGSMEKRDSFGKLLGTYNPFDVSACGAFGFSLDKNISLGLGSKWLRQDINGSVHTGLLWDFGFLARPSDWFSLGLNLKNLGVETGGYNLPTGLLLGTAYRFNLGEKGTHALTLGAGADVAFNGESKLNAGFEYGFEKSYFVRGGYSLDLANNNLGWIKGLNLGAGIKLGQFQLDYSFSFVGDLGDVQRVSLTILFPNSTKKEEVGKVPVSSGAATDLPPLESLFPSVAPEKTNKPVVLKFQVTSEDEWTPQQLFDKGEEKLGLGLKQEALDLYLKAVNKDPNFEKAWVRLGKLFFDKSLESYRKVLEMDPKNDKLREWLSHFKQ